jgi:hypothetical protein
VWGREAYTLVRGEPGPTDADGSGGDGGDGSDADHSHAPLESDLFAGLD